MNSIPIIFDNIVFSLQRAGGISVVWQELLSRFLKDEKYNFTFIEHPSDSKNVFRKKLDLSGGTIIGPAFHWLALDRYCNPFIRKDEPFIFHSSYFRTSSNKNAINITTVHDFTYDYFYKGKRRGAFLHLWQRNRAIRKADAVVCISENTKRDLLNFLPDVDPEKVHVIYNGVSEDYFEIDKSIPVELPFPSGSYVVFVGSRNSYKNFDFVVKTTAQSELNLVIVGCKLTKEEEGFVEKYFSKERYKSVGVLTNQELNIIYNHAMTLAYPSSYEGFGIPVLEAQRAGCPVIALNASSIPEVIGDTPCLMDELSEGEFLSKLEILKDKHARNAIIRRGIENSNRFSWDKMFKEYKKLYLSVWEDYIK